MQYSIKDIQKIDLDMCKEILKIFEKYKLRYYIIGGTFLGAIRHKGYIPWDDDMDIAMPRKDMEKFFEVAEKELPKNLKLITFENDKHYRYYLPRIVNLDTEIVEERYAHLNEKSNIFIDIFPIDGTPNNKLLRQIHYFKILFNRMLVSWYYIESIEPNRKRSKMEKILIFLGKILPTKKMINPKKRLIREIVPTEYFGKPTKYKFEDIYLTGPEKYDEYLTHMYGDYMKIPDDKKTHYSYKGEENEKSATI